MWLGQREHPVTNRRTIALDARTVAVLRAHRQRQRALFGPMGLSWTEAGYVFVTAEGRPYHPNYFTSVSST